MSCMIECDLLNKLKRKLDTLLFLNIQLRLIPQNIVFWVFILSGVAQQISR